MIPPTIATTTAGSAAQSTKDNNRDKLLKPPAIVVVGTSAGGLRALEKILSVLPAAFAIPIVAVQHRSRQSDAFARVMGSLTPLPVHEAEDKQRITAPGVYLAPPDYHLLVEPDGCLALSIDEPVSFSRPSIDVLFESAADVYGPRVLAILLTGANQDGTRGLGCVRAAGGIALVQDPRTAESPEMPNAAIAAGAVDRILPLADIADEIVRRSKLS